jgi:hypothetical protein
MEKSTCSKPPTSDELSIAKSVIEFILEVERK